MELAFGIALLLIFVGCGVLMGGVVFAIGYAAIVFYKRIFPNQSTLMLHVSIPGFAALMVYSGWLNGDFGKSKFIIVPIIFGVIISYLGFIHILWKGSKRKLGVKPKVKGEPVKRNVKYDI